MPASRDFSVDDVIDGRRLNRFQILILCLCAAAMVIDGYDVFVIGYVLPVLVKDLGIHAADITPALVGQQFGLAFGAYAFGPVADRIGRRRTLLICVAFACLSTAATTQATTVGELFVLRTVGAVFFSGLIPNVVALASEIVPTRFRATIVSIVFCGYSASGFVGSAVQAWVIGRFGWQGGFWVGTLLSVTLFLALFLFMPESVRFRVQKNPFDRRIGDVLRRIQPGLVFAGDERFVIRETPAPGGRVPMLQLFAGGRARTTGLLWLAFFMSMTVIALLAAWMTAVFRDVAGLSMAHIAANLSTYTTAAIIGTGTSGFIMDRFGPSRVLPVYFLGSALAIASLGLVDPNSPLLYLCFLAAGYFQSGGQGGLNSMSAITYPTSLRTTGVGWAFGCGRFGSMLGPVLGSAMLTRHWPMAAFFAATGCLSLVAALSMALVRRPAAGAAMAAATLAPSLAED
jgi:AAHS family 4-hydroxybenzoate transporter-like MFS transporter